MQTFPAQKQKTNRLVITVAVAAGLSIMGDSLMYGLLPLEAENLGIALPLVGILLSANRLVRLLSNTWASALFERFGPYKPFTAATILGFVTAVLYGVGWGFLVFLLARMGWGVAWSGLRQGGYEAVSTGKGRGRGRLMGILWGIVRLGSATSVLLGGYLRDLYGYQASVGVITLFTALAVPLAFSIRWPEDLQRKNEARTKQKTVSQLSKWRLALKTPAQRAILAAGFLDAFLEGVLISTAALFLTTQLGEAAPLAAYGIGIGTIAGLLLAVRFSASLIFGPLIGALSDRLGQSQTALLLAILTLVGLFGAVKLSGAGLILCLAVVFICRAGSFVTLSAASSAVATRSEIPHLFVGAYTTLFDAGAAAGPLLAYSVGQFLGLPIMYLTIAAMFLLAVGWFRQEERHYGS